MTKKQEQAEKKRIEIVTASLELFFEKGYEATSIRSIQAKVGSTVSLFYHYFDSKDKVFDEAIKLFFRSYELKMQEIITNAKNNPKNALDNYLNYMIVSTQEFRNKYLGTLHWTILSAIREYSLNIMKKYILEILYIYKENNIIDTPKEKLETVANLIAYGVGGSILYQSKESYIKQQEEINKNVNILLGIK